MGKRHKRMKSVQKMPPHRRAVILQDKLPMTATECRQKTDQMFERLRTATLAPMLNAAAKLAREKPTKLDW